MAILRVRDEKGNIIEILAVKGDPGPQGESGAGIASAVLNADYTLTLTFDDGTSYTTPSIRGATGAAGKDGSNGSDGADGEDGVSVTHSWNGTTLTVTSASGTSSADLKGEKGDQGEPGADGAKGDKGDTGATGADGYTPLRGTDYWTEADKAEMVNMVIAALPVYAGEVV